MKMSKPNSKDHASKVAAMIIPAWLITATFGDELFALIFFHSPDAAFEFSIGEPWWWAYQFIVASIFVLVISLVRSKTYYNQCIRNLDDNS